MRQIREVLRLKWALGYTDRQTAQACGVSRPAIKSYLRRALAADLQWPLPEGLDDPALEQLLFPPTASAGESRQRPLPDFAAMHQELRRKGVTLMLLWEEYKAGQPEGLQYSQYCEHYRRWVQRIKPSMRQVYRAGEKCFVDYAGQTVAVRYPYTGEQRQAQVFVAVLGASHYCYAEATWSQSLPDWIASHERALQYFGGVPELLVPDYVARHIIGLMCPSPLCAVPGGEALHAWPSAMVTPHNDSSRPDDEPPSLTMDWRLSCSPITSSNQLPSIAFERAGSARRSRRTWIGCALTDTASARFIIGFRFSVASRRLRNVMEPSTRRRPIR